MLRPDPGSRALGLVEAQGISDIPLGSVNVETHSHAVLEVITLVNLEQANVLGIYYTSENPAILVILPPGALTPRYPFQNRR